MTCAPLEQRFVERRWEELTAKNAEIAQKKAALPESWRLQEILGEVGCPPWSIPKGLNAIGGRPRSREAYGVRGACSRFRWFATFDSWSKLHALHTLRAVRLRLRCALLFAVNHWKVFVAARWWTGGAQV